MDVVIYKREAEWNEIDQVSSMIEQWEQRNQIRLPEDYRAFMLKYDGGYIYPLILDHNGPQWFAMDENIFVEPIYSWDYVEKLWEEPNQTHPRPKNTLEIAADPGGIGVLMSLAEDTFGQIWLNAYLAGPDDDEPRYHNTYVAASFRELIFEKLYETDDNEGYDYWYIPDTKFHTKKVEF